MSEGTRRIFLTTSGFGVAAAGVAVTMTPAAAGVARSGTAAAAVPPLSDMSGSLVAFVSDVRAAEISVMVGEDEIVVHDKDLVARLLRATNR